MLRKRLFTTVFTIVLLSMAVGIAHGDYLTTRPDYAGVWINLFGRPENLTPYLHFLAGEASKPKWSRIESTQGVFDFSEFGDALTRALDGNYYYYCEFWTGSHTPRWIYARGVPLVTTDNRNFPYYLDANYQAYLSTFFDKMAEYLSLLPANKLERLAFIQPGFGSTGDRQLYKGTPDDPKYVIDSNAYLGYMQNMTTALHKAFDTYPETRDIKFLWNIGDYDGSDPSELDGVPDSKRGELLYGKWVRDNYDAQFRKQQFTPAIGYMAVNEKDQDTEQRPHFYGVGSPLRWSGNAEFIRGEHNDAKWARTPMAKLAKKWHFYWTAISSVDRGIDAWETKWAWLSSGDYTEAYEFSYRYSYYKKAATSPYAFVALRDVLDYSDTDRFPEATYGAATRSNTTRINTILSEYSSYGAANGDTRAVVKYGTSAYLLRSTALNDCVWNVIDRNYRRHISQYNPNGTSVGLWRVGSTSEPYGRFARSFENSSGKNAMYFTFDNDFFDRPAGEVTIKVIYKDQPAGSTWELKYDAGAGNFKKAYTVVNTGDNTWKTKTITVTDAVMAGNGPNGCDFALCNSDGLDDVFHMIEIERPLRGGSKLRADGAGEH